MTPIKPAAQNTAAAQWIFDDPDLDGTVTLRLTYGLGWEAWLEVVGFIDEDAGEVPKTRLLEQEEIVRLLIRTQVVYRDGSVPRKEMEELWARTAFNAAEDKRITAILREKGVPT